MKKVLFLVVTLFSSLVLVGCASDSTPTENQLDRENIDLTFYVTSGASTNEAGTGWTGGNRIEVTKTFKTNPQTVAIFSYDVLDILDTVGFDQTSITHLGIPKNNLPSYLNTYNAAHVENVGTLFIPDWDKLDLFMPDLIIIGSRSAGAYDRLVEQYPYADILDVVMETGEYAEGMTSNASNLAKIFPTVSDEILNELDEIIAEMEEIKSIAKDYQGLLIMVNGEALSFYGPTGRFAMLHDEFGFVPADANAEEGGSHGNVVGYEYVASVNPQVLFLLDRGVAVGGSSTTNAVIANQLIQDTTAGQTNHIYVLDPIAWYISTGGFQSTRKMISDLEPFIESIAE